MEQKLALTTALGEVVRARDPRTGRWSMMEAPVVPAVPRLSSNPIAAVQQIRGWYNQVFFVQQWRSNQGVRPINFNPKMIQLSINFKRNFPMYLKFLRVVWSFMLPGEFASIAGGNFIGERAYTRRRRKKAMVTRAMLFPSYRPPARTDARPIGTRIMTMVEVSKRLLRQDVGRDFPNYVNFFEPWFSNLNLPEQKLLSRSTTMAEITKHLRPTSIRQFPAYLASLASWVGDLSFPEQELVNRAQRYVTMTQAFSGVPWPHTFFFTFLTSPTVSTPPFGGGFQYRDGGIILSNYFPTNVKQVQRDIAYYLTNNEELFFENFERGFNRWLKRKEDRLKEKVKAAKRLGRILNVLGIVLGVLSVGLVLVAVAAIARATFDVHQARRLGKAQRGAMKKILAVIGSTEAKLDIFRNWILARIKSRMPPPPTPEPPKGVEKEQWSVFVNGEFKGNGRSPGNLANRIFKTTSIGAKVVFKNEVSGESRMFLREERGFRPVPPEIESKVESLPPASVRRVVIQAPRPVPQVVIPKGAPPLKPVPKKEEAGFPWWLIPVGGFFIL